MTIHSSFLIRCWLSSDAGPNGVRLYEVEHVQTGQQLKTTDSAEITRWIASINRPYMEVQLASLEGDHDSD